VILDEVRAHLVAHFASAGVTSVPESATVRFLGVEGIDVLRFGPDRDGVMHYVSLGGSRHGMGDDPVAGPRAEVVLSLRGTAVGAGLARSVAVLAAAPVVEGLVLTPDALVDLGQPLWNVVSPPGRYGPTPGGAPFTAFLLGHSDIEPTAGVEFLRAVPITANEAAWVRLKGADAMRQAWIEDGVDVLDSER
jgi:Suppressor of fused protein (SUFU)